RALFESDLTADQIICLDTGRSFIDGRNARIAQVLRRAGFLDEAHAAVDLDPGGSDFHALLRAPAFDHGDQQIDQRLAPALLRRVRVALCLVPRRPREAGTRAHGLRLRAHAHQHPAHAGMVDDRAAVAAALPALTTLHASPGVLQSVLIRTLADS